MASKKACTVTPRPTGSLTRSLWRGPGLVLPRDRIGLSDAHMIGCMVRLRQGASCLSIRPSWRIASFFRVRGVLTAHRDTSFPERSGREPEKGFDSTDTPIAGGGRSGTVNEIGNPMNSPLENELLDDQTRPFWSEAIAKWRPVRFRLVFQESGRRPAMDSRLPSSGKGKGPMLRPSWDPTFVGVCLSCRLFYASGLCSSLLTMTGAALTNSHHGTILHAANRNSSRRIGSSPVL